MSDRRVRVAAFVFALSVCVGIGAVAPDPAFAEIPKVIYDQSRSDDRPIWVSSRTFDAQGIPDFDLLAPATAERLKQSLASGKSVDPPDSLDWMSPGYCDVTSRMVAEYPPRYDASDVFKTVLSAHVGQITGVDTGFFGSNPATLIELTATDDFVRGDDGLERRDANGRTQLFVHTAARLNIGGLSVCDFSARELPASVVGHDALILVEQPPVGATGIPWTSEGLLIIRPPEGKIFAPGVLRDLDLTGDLSATVVELYRLWMAKERQQ